MLDNILGKLVYPARIRSSTTQVLDDFKQKSALQTGIDWVNRFGSNNRTLARNLTGGRL